MSEQSQQTPSTDPETSDTPADLTTEERTKLEEYDPSLVSDMWD
jgi:hypothetical protein